MNIVKRQETRAREKERLVHVARGKGKIKRQEAKVIEEVAKGKVRQGKGRGGGWDIVDYSWVD